QISEVMDLFEFKYLGTCQVITAGVSVGLIAITSFHNLAYISTTECPKYYLAFTNEWNKNDDRLLQAVENGDAEKVASLLGKKGASATKHDSEGKTAFHLAAAKGHVECLKVMVTHGVDVTAQDTSGHSALHIAAKNGHPEYIKKLLQ
ncbi:hypothetical protein STEG23_015382, partial [Scotinomys teguina]